jgi:hypothetical protein
VTDIGPVEVDIPRDRDGTFEPRIVRQRQLSGIDGLVIWLSARATPGASRSTTSY